MSEQYDGYVSHVMMDWMNRLDDHQLSILSGAALQLLAIRTGLTPHQIVSAWMDDFRPSDDEWLGGLRDNLTLEFQLASSGDIVEEGE